MQCLLLNGPRGGVLNRPIARSTRPPLTRRSRREGLPRSQAIATAVQSIPQALEVLLKRRDLTKAQTRDTLDKLLEEPDAAQIAAFLVLLRAKGESAQEIAGLAECLQERAVEVSVPFDVVDIVGTGGDGIGSVNISTGASVIAAAAGAKVAKHGNRSVSSLSGSADVLEALDIAIDLGPEGVAACIQEAGIGFMFAPRYSPHMKFVKSVRQSLQLRTVFNILGPMLNPARAKYGLIGVYSPKLMKTMGDALMSLSVKKALIVHSMGLDELTPMGEANVLEVTPGGTHAYTIDPKDFGIPRCTVDDLRGGDKIVNATILKEVFAGARTAVADALNLNAGFALAAYGVTESPHDGVALAQEVQRSGKATATLEKWIDICREAKAKEMNVTTR